MVLLGGGLPGLKLEARVKGCTDGINGHVSLNKANIQVGKYRLQFELERDGFRKVYLHLTGYA